MREVGSPIDLVRKMTWEEVIQPTLEDAVPVALTDIELKQSAIASTISDVNPATFVSTFITNQVMFPNGHAVTAGIDTFNGTWAFMGYDNFKRAIKDMETAPTLMKLRLRVTHVGGGDLVLHGLWKGANLMINGQPKTTHIVIGSMAISSAAVLFGIPMLHHQTSRCWICCASLLCWFLDDDGDHGCRACSLFFTSLAPSRKYKMLAAT